MNTFSVELSKLRRSSNSSNCEVDLQGARSHCLRLAASLDGDKGTIRGPTTLTIGHLRLTPPMILTTEQFNFPAHFKGGCYFW